MKNHKENLERKDNEEGESICSKKSSVLLENSTVSKKGDDEDEGSDSYQNIGGMIQEIWLSKMLRRKHIVKNQKKNSK